MTSPINKAHTKSSHGNATVIPMMPPTINMNATYPIYNLPLQARRIVRSVPTVATMLVIPATYHIYG